MASIKQRVGERFPRTVAELSQPVEEWAVFDMSDYM